MGSGSSPGPIRLSWLTAVQVGIGSGAGSVARWAASEAITDPWLALWLVNLVGSCCLGALAGWTARRQWVTPVLGVGFLGGFTTFSAVTVLAAASGTAGVLDLVGQTLLAVLAAGLGRGVAARRGRSPR